MLRLGYMESTMENTTSMTTPPEQVDSLIQMVADEAGLVLAGKLDTAGPVGSGGAVVEEKGSYFV
jgi:charged multivesicular body protein 1